MCLTLALFSILKGREGGFSWASEKRFVSQQQRELQQHERYVEIELK